MKRPTHKIYRTTNWPAYNRALIHRGNIAIWFDPATQWYAPSKGKQGLNQTYSDAAIQRCILWAYDTKQCRQAITDWQAHAVIPPRKNAKPCKDTKSSSLERNE